MQLKYQGFSIYGKSLCVVVEPYPLPAKVQKPLNEALGVQERSRLSMPPQRPIQSAPQTKTRGVTPLFLPDDADVPEFPNDAPMYTMDEEDSDDDVEHPFKHMMAFTQSLKNAGDNRPGAAQDDEDIDSAALFGDADEVRDL